MRRYLRWLCLGLLMALIGLQPGCDGLTPSDRALVRSFAEDWMRSRNMHPTNEDGSPNLVAALNIGRRAITGRSGNAEVDAVLDAYEVLSNLHEADKLMEQGRRDGDPDAMDQAIARRPEDWTYRTSRATLALASGDVESWQAQQDKAEEIVVERNIDPVWYHEQSLRDYDRLGADVLTNPQCKLILERVIYHRLQLVNLTGDTAYAMPLEGLIDARDMQCP